MTNQIIAKNLFKECILNKNTDYLNDLNNDGIINFEEIKKILLLFDPENESINGIYKNIYDNIKFFASKAPLYREVIGKSFFDFKTNLFDLIPYVQIALLKETLANSQDEISTHFALLIIKELTHNTLKDRWPYDFLGIAETEKAIEETNTKLRNNELEWYVSQNDRLIRVYDYEAILNIRNIYSFDDLNRLFIFKPRLSKGEYEYIFYSKILRKNIDRIRIDKLNRNEEFKGYTLAIEDVYSEILNNQEEFLHHNSHKQIVNFLKIDSKNLNKFKSELLFKIHQTLCDKYGENNTSILQTISSLFLAHLGIIKIEPDVIENNNQFYLQDNLRNKVKHLLKDKHKKRL